MEKMHRSRWRAFITLLLCLGAPAWLAAAQPLPPVVIGLTAEFGVQGSQAAQSIEKGIALAIDEINAAGGVLGGRQLKLEIRDDRGVPARGVDNFADFARQPDVVAVFCGRFSPVALEIAPQASKLGLLLLDPWSAADDITKPRGSEPNYAFRLSLTDSWAIETMLEHARARGINRIAMFVPNTAWGRSSEAAMLAYANRHAALRHEVFWYNWGDTDFSDRLAQARAKGAQAILTVTNEFEGLPIIKQMASLPAAQRLPIISHWGLLGGDFGAAARPYLEQVDFSVVHTFSFSDPHGAKAQTVAAGVKRLFGLEVSQMRAQVGFAHAYDMTHLLALAINKAGSSNRAAIRSALERLDAHEGLVRHYAKPFTPARHEAFEKRQVRMARFDKDGTLKSIAGK
ncbi:MAG: ABC transporter substrate-binding protein [Hylemonella sp.]|nr:ABC transporter substrate-binding protein [Hylemonella sp.]MDP1936121.1 ABC transporter substrate-binding protein [Hylemonella sp.]